MNNPPNVRDNSPIGIIEGRQTIIPGIIHYAAGARFAYWLSPERQAQLPAWVKEPDGTIVKTHQDPAWWEGPEKNIIVLAFEDECRLAYYKDFDWTEDPDWEDVIHKIKYRLRNSHPTMYARYERSRA